MINKLFAITSLCCLMVANGYAEDKSATACRDCEDKDGFDLVSDTSKSHKRCPCEGNVDSENSLASSSGSSADSASSISPVSESFSSSSV